MRLHYLLLASLWAVSSACSSKSDGGTLISGGGNGSGGASAGTPGGNAGNPSQSGSGGYIDFGDAGCARTTCAKLGWACGYTVDVCGGVINCADEGLACGANEVCVGGIDGPTQCVTGPDMTCELCGSVPDCTTAAQPTRLTGRVVTPGRNATDTANQVGVPNALVYILRSNAEADLPAIASGIPSGGESCDRCEEQDLGPLLAGAITDAAGNYTIEGNVPVGVDFLLVVKAGKFRRAEVIPALPVEKACQDSPLPSAVADGNPTRLPRAQTDGLAVNIPKIAISTGRIDAIECVFEKMGIAASEFGNFGAPGRIDLYRGGPAGAPEGASIDADTPADAALYGALDRLQSYDMVVSDCEGQSWDGRTPANGFPERVASGDNVREYVNRGGRMFASHLSMSWIHENGTAAYSDADPIATGLAAAASWDINYLLNGINGNLNTTGTGVVSLVGARPNASPRIQSFADWLVSEAVTTSPGFQFTITDPRSLAASLGSDSEEFVYRTDGNGRVQQFSFDTPYAAPDGAACGRVAYSGFHVAATNGGAQPFLTSVFPVHCAGNLTNQEKVLLYMLFDLGACVGDEPLPPPCVPTTCGESGSRRCGFAPDGCGNVLDCGPCRPPA